MHVSIIAACDAQWGIGKEGKMPWHLPADFAYFKQTTMGFPLISGRKNFQDMGVLPGRHIYVITRDESFTSEDDSVTVAYSLKQALAHAKTREDASEIFIVGGGEIYKAALEEGLVDRAYITRVGGEAYDCDTFFPHELLEQNFTESYQTSYAADEDNDRDLTFITYERAQAQDGQ